jgi:hypothetical protein
LIRTRIRLDYRRMKTTLLLTVVAILAVGCATTRRPPPLTQSDVMSMVKAGLTDEDIIRRIDASGTVFRLSADDVVNLRKEGVSDRVVTYMLDTYTRYVAAEQRRQDYYDYDWHYRFSFYYGHPWHHR